MNRNNSFTLMGVALLCVGFLLFILVVSNLPSKFWSPGLVDVRWYKINGLEMANGNPQYKLDRPETGGGPTSAELTRLALEADPYFFEASPVGQNTHLISYEKFYPVSQHFTQKYESALIGSLVFKVTPNLSNSVNGYIGAFVSVVVGLILVGKGRSKTKQSTQQRSRNSLKSDKDSLEPIQVEGQDRRSKRKAITSEQPLTPERNQVVHLTHEIICSKCGYAGLPTDKFCRKCGSPIKSEIHCEKCDNIVQPKDLYCVKCGSYLGSKNVAADHNESATPVQQKKTPVESHNPFTADAVIKSGTLLFKCPTCVNTISVTLQRIDPIVGVSVLCSSCKNISHVPGMYLSEPRPADTRITGGIRLPIAKFSDWYYEHPYIASLIKNGQSDLLFDYGLWAFCNTCYHQYPSTVLNSFAMAQVTYFSNPNFTGDFVFNAQTPESANDMAALRSGHCSHCHDKNLIVIVSEIPDYIMTTIMSKRK